MPVRQRIVEVNTQTSALSFVSAQNLHIGLYLCVTFRFGVDRFRFVPRFFATSLVPLCVPFSGQQTEPSWQMTIDECAGNSRE